MVSVVVLLIIFCSCFTLTISTKSEFKLHLIHLNDFHARFEETSKQSGTCNNDCIGGFSRIYTAIKQQMKKYPLSILLNAGDNFQGTIFYNIYKWNVTQYFLNKLPFDAYTLGNHEFDDNIKGLVPFIKALNAPTLAVNIDDREEPQFQGVYKKSIVIARGNKRIGIIGVVLATTDAITNSGKLKFLNESETVNKEAERLVAEKNVDTVIVLSHCGYEVEKEIARKSTSKISAIVGAHSHSYLNTGGKTVNGKIPEGPYPTVIKRDDGRKVLVVQAAAYTEFLGAITINYDSTGNVISWSGAPIYINNLIPQDAKINAEIAEWNRDLVALGNEVIGYSKVTLDHSTCRVSECNFGNFIADAMVHAYLDTDEVGAWAYASIAVTIPGGIRTSIPTGNITFNDLLTSIPFENTIDVGELKGKYIKGFLEQSAIPYKNQRQQSPVNLLQISGMRVVYNLSKPEGSKVAHIEVLCRKCPIPRYEPLELDKNYRIAINSFLADGGDGFNVISDNLINRKVGDLDTEVLKRYIQQRSPIVQSVDGRIQFIGQLNKF